MQGLLIDWVKLEFKEVDYGGVCPLKHRDKIEACLQCLRDLRERCAETECIIQNEFLKHYTI